MNRRFISTLAVIVTANLSPAVHAFVSPGQQSMTKIIASPITTPLNTPTPLSSKESIQQIHHTTITSTSLQMGYQLPPSGGGGPKGPLDEIKSILPTIGSAILVALFFASPLGGIFFAIFNSFFVLALLTPLILFGGFQIWTALYTIEEPCPSCGRLPVRVLKSGEPSVCINCGAYSRANEKGDGLELCNNPNDVMQGSLFDSLFGGGMGGNGMGGNGMSDFTDVFTDGPKNESGVDEQAKKAKRQGTIIDVDVERD